MAVETNPDAAALAAHGAKIAGAQLKLRETLAAVSAEIAAAKAIAPGPGAPA